MPSNATQLPESDDTEPDLPVPVRNLSGLSLLDDESLSESRDVPHLGGLGAVLDLQPLCHNEENNNNNNIIVRYDGDPEQMRARVAALEVSGPGRSFQDGMVEVDWRMMMMEDGEMCLLNTRRRSVNTTECVVVPTSEHVAEIVGRQGCKIKALRAKTNTYIKTPVRGEEPAFVVTGRKEDVATAKREIMSAAEHFSQIRASRNKVTAGSGLTSPPGHPGQTTIQVRVPYRMVGLVVGPKGATIKRIQQHTHTYIVTPSREKEPVFEVTGMPENVDRAREEIQAHIAQRTSGSVDSGADDDDFHYNGTDVGFALAGAWTFSDANGFRDDSSSSLGSTSSESFYGGMAENSPACTFWFGGSPVERGGASLPTTPRLSPSLPEDHPLARLVQENSQSLPAFGPVFSPSSDSAGSGSPPAGYAEHGRVSAGGKNPFSSSA